MTHPVNCRHRCRCKRACVCVHATKLLWFSKAFPINQLLPNGDQIKSHFNVRSILNSNRVCALFDMSWNKNESHHCLHNSFLYLRENDGVYSKCSLLTTVHRAWICLMAFSHQRVRDGVVYLLLGGRGGLVRQVRNPQELLPLGCRDHPDLSGAKISTTSVHSQKRRTANAGWLGNTNLNDLTGRSWAERFSSWRW